VASVYHNLGGGGVDFPAVFKVLRDRHYEGWAIFDVDDYIAHNTNYLRDVLDVRLPPPG
jgi:sugar phosphate isomerase/epimerase